MLLNLDIMNCGKYVMSYRLYNVFLSTQLKYTLTQNTHQKMEYNQNKIIWNIIRTGKAALQACVSQVSADSTVFTTKSRITTTVDQVSDL